MRAFKEKEVAQAGAWAGYTLPVPDYLLLPAKEEAENLPWVLERAKAVGLTPVVCDDGSRDQTGEVARKWGAIVLEHRENKGLAEAVRSLLSFALRQGRPGDLFLLMDADGTMDPVLFPEMKRVLRDEGAEIVIASRYRGGGAKGLGPSRRFFSWAARFYFTFLFPGLNVTDWTTGWRLYAYEFLERYAAAYPFLFRAKGFAAQTEILLRSASLCPRVRVAEIGAEIRYDRKRGRSKMRLFSTAREYAVLGLRVRFASLLGKGG